MGAFSTVSRDAILPGFGIIKLVIAIAIVVVFSLVVYANLASRRSADERVAEARTLQQWGIALNLYLIENENQLPSVGTTPITPEQKTAWFNVLPPYISQTPLAELPPGQRPRPGVPSIWIRPGSKPVKIWDTEQFYFNYGMNRALQPVADVRSFRIFEIPFPGNVVFLAPTAGYDPSSEKSTLATQKDLKATVPILFCDGHVQPVSAAILRAPESLAAPTSSDAVSWFQQ